MRWVYEKAYYKGFFKSFADTELIFNKWFMFEVYNWCVLTCVCTYKSTIMIKIMNSVIISSYATPLSNSTPTLSPGKHWCVFFHYRFICIFTTLYKWNHTICSFLFLSVNIIILRFIYIFIYINSSSISVTEVQLIAFFSFINNFFGIISI